MTRVLYVATVVKTHIMEFHIPYLRMIKDMGWETAVASRNDYDVASECSIPFCDEFYDIPFSRNPIRVGNIKAYKQLKKVIENGDFDIIHCHTPVGAMLARLAARGARKRGCKVFYTAHGFHFYKGAPLMNWIVYYPVEKYLASLTDVLITITKEDYKRAINFPAGAVEYTPGVGVDIARFKKDHIDNSNTLKQELGIPNSVKVLLSVGEVNANKNHMAVISVLPHFDNVWYVICGRGPLIEDCKKMAEKLGVSDRLVMTGYRDDIDRFYNMADLFIFPSIREGLPVALMEAMAGELICVASKNRGTDDLLPESRLCFNVRDSEDLKAKLKIALTEDCSDEIQKNLRTLKDFDIDNSLTIMKKLYLSYVK